MSSISDRVGELWAKQEDSYRLTVMPEALGEFDESVFSMEAACILVARTLDADRHTPPPLGSYLGGELRGQVDAYISLLNDFAERSDDRTWGTVIEELGTMVVAGIGEVATKE